MDNESRTISKQALAFIYIFFISNIIYMLAIREELLNTSLVFSTLASLTFLAIMVLSFFFMASYLSQNYSTTVVKNVLPWRLPQIGVGLLAIIAFVPMIAAYFIPEEILSLQKWSTATAGFIILVTLPYLFTITKMLDSKYLINSLFAKIRSNFLALEQDPENEKLRETNLTLIEALTNTALVSGQKGDIAQVKHILRNSYQVLTLLLNNYNSGNLRWRENSEDDRTNRLWPESFILRKLYISLTALDDISSLSNLLNYKLDLLKSCNDTYKEPLSQLFMTSYNSYINHALSTKNEDQFNVISYFYCQALEQIIHTPASFESSSSDLMHYCRQLISKKMIDSFQISLHDISQIVIRIGKKNQDVTSQFLNNHLFPMLKMATKSSKHLRNEAEKCIVKIYWEARVRNLEKIHQFIINNYLIDQGSHLNTLKILHSTRTPLSRRYNTHQELNTPLSKDAEMLSLRFVKHAGTQ